MSRLSPRVAPRLVKIRCAWFLHDTPVTKMAVPAWLMHLATGSTYAKSGEAGYKRKEHVKAGASRVYMASRKHGVRIQLSSRDTTLELALNLYS